MQRRPEPVRPMIWLTAKERQILELMCQGQTTGEIAGCLQISEPSVYFHRAKLRTKLQVKTDTQLAIWGIHHPDDVYRGCTRSPGLQPAVERAA